MHGDVHIGVLPGPFSRVALYTNYVLITKMIDVINSAQTTPTHYALIFFPWGELCMSKAKHLF